MVQAVKLSRKDLQGELTRLLEKLGAVHEGRLYGGYVFFSERDLQLIRRSYRRQVRKTLPRAPKSAIDGYTDEYFQSLPTNSSLSKIVKPGFVLVDREGIDQSVTKAKNFIARAEAARKAIQAEKDATFVGGIKKFFADNFGEPIKRDA